MVAFGALVVGLALILRRYPVLAVAMALGPCVVTLIGVAWALLFPPSEI
jgi:hypothetical protein